MGKDFRLINASNGKPQSGSKLPKTGSNMSIKGSPLFLQESAHRILKSARISLLLSGLKGPAKAIR
jgi:hypothetical protein